MKKAHVAATLLLWVLVATTLHAHANANGRLEASGVIYVEDTRVASEVQGEIVEVLAEPGDAVANGDPLIVLDSSSVASSVQEARIALQTAEAQLQVVKSGPRTEEVAGKQAQLAMAQAERSRALALHQAALRALDDPQELRQQLLEAMAQVSLAQAAVEAAEAQHALLQHQVDDAKWNSTERHILEHQAKAAEAELAAAQADVRTAETALSHLQKMADNPLDYLVAVHESEGAYRIADARVRVSQAELRDLIQGATPEELALSETAVQLAAANLELARLRAERLTIRSPVDGTVTARMASAGETALAGATLLTLADLSEVSLVVYVPQSALSQVSLGQRVDVAVDSFPSRRFEGMVTHIASEAQYTPRNVASKEERVNTVYEVTVRVPNGEGKLKAGMPADAVFH